MDLSTFKEEKKMKENDDDMFQFETRADVSDFDLEENAEVSEAKAMISKFNGLKIAFINKGESVIYVAISKHKT